MSRSDMEKECLKPSKKWVESGDGHFGRVYLEILSCKDLPNLDLGGSDVSDPFVAVVFENSMTQTNVVYNSLTPLWMPWATRAFCFNVCHPSSLIFLGIFDYDEITQHSPIGRVVINTSKFRSNTSYLLHYQLFDDITKTKKHGTITIRIRVEWENESDAINAAMTSPPRFLINVDTSKSLDLLRYMCRGPTNMDHATVDSIKILYAELKEYGNVFCYVIDIIIEILLWRGRTTLKFCILNRNMNISLWFPIHSIFLFTSTALAIEFPLLIPSIFLYSIAWILLSMGYSTWTHPDPWQRCKSAQELTMIRLLGRDITSGQQTIKPDNDAIAKAEALEELDKAKAKRVAHFLSDLMKLALKLRRIIKKTIITSK